MTFEITLQKTPFVQFKELKEYGSFQEFKSEYKSIFPIVSFTIIDYMPFVKWSVDYTLTSLSGNYNDSGNEIISARTKEEAEELCRKICKTRNDIVNWAWATEIKDD